MCRLQQFREFIGLNRIGPPVIFFQNEFARQPVTGKMNHIPTVSIRQNFG